MNHEWSEQHIPFLVPTAVCHRCGVTGREWLDGGRSIAGPCTGNAYICRVVRKIRVPGLNNGPWHKIVQREGFSTGVEEVHPWTATADMLRALIASVIEDRFKVGAISGLLRSVAENPTVCPILADALEDAGCTDAALLEALRTP